MAIIAHPLQPRLRAARVSRGRLTLQGANTLVIMALLAALMALANLGQTGRVATRGYELAQLEQQRVALIREGDRLRLQLAQAQSLQRIEKRASEILGMRPVGPLQARYLTVEVQAVPALAQGQR